LDILVDLSTPGLGSRIGVDVLVFIGGTMIGEGVLVFMGIDFRIASVELICSKLKASVGFFPSSSASVFSNARISFSKKANASSMLQL